MRRFWLFAVLVVLVLSAAPVWAQTDPPAAPVELSRTEIVLIGALFVALALFTIFGAVIASLASKLLNAMPPWAADIVRAGMDTGYARIEDLTDSTSSLADDEFAERLRAELERLGLLSPKPAEPSPGVQNISQE